MWQLSEQPNPSPCLPKRSGYSHQLKCIRSNRIFEGGGAELYHRERFFGLSGYISSPRRSRLGVHTYERVAMLASIIQNVYIDNDWVAQQYIERGKRGSWKKENTEEALKCWNLERIINAEQQGNDAPSELKM